MDYESLWRIAWDQAQRDGSSSGLFLVCIFFVALVACWIGSIPSPARTDEAGPTRELIRGLMAKGRASLAPEASGIPADRSL